MPSSSFSPSVLGLAFLFLADGFACVPCFPPVAAAARRLRSTCRGVGLVPSALTGRAVQFELAAAEPADPEDPVAGAPSPAWRSSCVAGRGILLDEFAVMGTVSVAPEVGTSAREE